MAETFNIQLEADLSEFDSTVTDGGDLAWSASAALAGTDGGLLCLIDDTTAIYGHIAFSQFSGTTFRFRIYIDPNTLTMGASEAFFFCRIYDPATAPRCSVALSYSSGYYITVYLQNDSGVTTSSAWAISDAPHYIEVQAVRATGAVASDGTLDLWIDDVLKEQVTGIDLYDLSQPDRARIGAVFGVDSGTSGTFYLDEFVLRDDGTEIGAVGGTTPPDPPTPGTSPFWDGTWGMPPGACGYNAIFGWTYTSNYVRGGQYWPRSLEWPRNSGTVITYKQLCSQMAARGANLLRLRLDGANDPYGGGLFSFEPPPYGTFNVAHKVLDPSSIGTYRSDQGTAPTFNGHWSGSNLERLVNACGSYDIKLQVAFFHPYEFSSYWAYHPWNASNRYLNGVACGTADQGFLSNATALFTDATALQAAKDRITAIIESVGSTTAVAAWELCAEAVWFAVPSFWGRTSFDATMRSNVRTKVVPWMQALAQHVGSSDPHNRPIASTFIRIPPTAWSADPDNFWNVVNEITVASPSITLVGVNAYTNGDYDETLRYFRMAQEYAGTAGGRTVFIDQYEGSDNSHPPNATEPSPYLPSKAIQWIGAVGAAWGIGPMRWTGFNESSPNNWVDGNVADPAMSTVAGVCSTFAQYVNWEAHRVSWSQRHAAFTSTGLDSVVASGNAQYVTFFAKWTTDGSKYIYISGMTNGAYTLHLFNWVTGAHWVEMPLTVTTGTAVFIVLISQPENRLAGYLEPLTVTTTASATISRTESITATAITSNVQPAQEVSTSTDAPTRYELRIRGANGSETARMGIGYPDPRGHYVGPFQYVKRVNSPGGLTLRMNADHPARSDLEENGQVEVWREAGGGWYRDFTAIWTDDYDYEYRDELEMTGYAPGHLVMLDWASVAWAAGSANRSKFTAVEAETVAKTLVTYNATSSAGTANGRDLDWRGPFTISVESDLGRGEALDVACPRQPLLETLQEVAASGGGDFDLTRSTTDPLAWTFRWYNSQRGTDRTDTVRFGVEHANVTNVRYSHRGSQNKTAAVVGGRGEGTGRDIVVRLASTDGSTRHREAFVNATEVDLGETDALADKGDRFLGENADTEVFDFEVIQAPGSRYGVHYCQDGVMGDLVTVVRPHDGEEQTHKIVGVTVAVGRDGSESITVETEQQ